MLLCMAEVHPRPLTGTVLSTQGNLGNSYRLENHVLCLFVHMKVWLQKWEWASVHHYMYRRLPQSDRLRGMSGGGEAREAR
jgi:hypothetical protein